MADDGTPAAIDDLKENVACPVYIPPQSRLKDCNGKIWKPNDTMKTKDEESPDENKTNQELVKTVRGILNKLTSSTFDKSLQRIKNLEINTEERLTLIIELFHQKAVKEPLYSSTYARMCQSLSSKEVPCSAKLHETINFRKLLLTKCEREFELGRTGYLDANAKKKEFEENKNKAKEQELKNELNILVANYRNRFSGNVRFLGELFDLKIVSAKIIHQCLARLFNQPDVESSIEQICVLLTTSGKALELPVPSVAANALLHFSQKKQMDSYIARLETIVNEHDISTELRFMIKDVIDLRNNQWNPRLEEKNCLKTSDQIHKEAIRERQQQEREWNPIINRVGRKDDDWNELEKSNRGNTKMSTKQPRIPKRSSCVGHDRERDDFDSPVRSQNSVELADGRSRSLQSFATHTREVPSVHEPSKDILQREVNATVNPGTTTASSLMYDEFQRNLEHFLKGSKRSILEISNWIKNQPVETKNPLFIRTLSTTVMEISLNGNGSESKLNTALFNHFSELLRDYIEHVAERELQLLFAVQRLVTQRKHPKGLIQEILEILYNWNVISEDGFDSWVMNEESSEREGKAATLKSSSSFITWLKEADSESGQEKDD